MRGSGYSIRRYLPGDETAIVDIVNRVFGAAGELTEPRDAAWWRWKYASNPAGSHTLVAVDDEGRLVAHYGGTPISVRCDGRTVQFGQNCDACSDPALRRGLRNPGLFVRLAQAYASTFGSPSEDAVMYGLPVPEHYRIGVRYLDYWMLRSQFALVCRDPARLPSWAWAMHAVEVTDFPADSDELATRLEAAHRCVGRRDAAFLNWRFRDHPAKPYRCAVARPGEGGTLSGHVVYRSARFATRPSGLIVDWFVDPNNEAAAHSLLRWAVERGAQDGHHELRFVCPTSSAWFEKFQEWGFEVEPTPYVMTARPYAQQFQPSFLRDEWYYTLADFDLA